MNKLFSRAVRNITLAAVFGLSAFAAQAGLVKYNFNVTIGSAGPLANQAYAGSFSFDDAAGATSGGETRFALSSFDFNFAGTAYTKTDLDSGSDAVFAGSNFEGLEATNSVFSFIAEFGDLNFAFEIPGIGINYGAVSAHVPEPETLALVLGGLGLMGFTRRNRRVKVNSLSPAAA